MIQASTPSLFDIARKILRARQVEIQLLKILFLEVTTWETRSAKSNQYHFPFHDLCSDWIQKDYNKGVFMA